MRVSVFGLWGWVRTVWVCFSLFKKELRDRLTNVLVSGTMGMKNGRFAVVPYLCRDYYRIKSRWRLRQLSCTLPMQGLLLIKSIVQCHHCCSGCTLPMQGLLLSNVRNEVCFSYSGAPYLCRYYYCFICLKRENVKNSYTLPTQVSPKQKSETQHEFRFLLSMLLSPKLFLLTQPQAQEEEQHAHPDDRWVAVLPAQLRHPLKIHPVPAH